MVSKDIYVSLHLYTLIVSYLKWFFLVSSAGPHMQADCYIYVVSSCAVPRILFSLVLARSERDLESCSGCLIT